MRSGVWANGPGHTACVCGRGAATALPTLGCPRTHPLGQSAVFLATHLREGSPRHFSHMAMLTCSVLPGALCQAESVSLSVRWAARRLERFWKFCEYTYQIFTRELSSCFPRVSPARERAIFCSADLSIVSFAVQPLTLICTTDRTR